MRPEPGPLPPAAIRYLAGATVLPMTSASEPACGILDADGAPVAAGRTRLSGKRMTPDPPAPEGPVAHLPGLWLFAGIGRHHFGHFLMEATPRLWALDHLTKRPNGILLIPMTGRDIAAVLRRRLAPLFDGLSHGLRLHLVDTPTRVDEVILPTQGFGHLDWSHGTPEARRYMRHHVRSIAPADGAERLYLSRRRLKTPAQKVSNEARIERWMARADFQVFHPERHSIKEQIARYRAARVIVGPDGSAFHLAACAMARGTRVGLIQRRTRQPVFDAIARQITGFAAADLWTTAALAHLPPPDPEPPEDRTPIELHRLRADLQAAGFL